MTTPEGGTGAASAASGLGAYATVTGAYWALMLTDGTLRMLVLLHFHSLGYDPIQLAYLFLLYEFLGMITNLAAGWIAARFGLTLTLYAGLATQVAALLALAQLQADWPVTASVLFVMAVQGAAGIAKDLTKTSAKSAVRLLVPDGARGRLFRWVALLTGSKNAVKGLGFLAGALLLALAGFEASLYGMAALLGLTCLGCMIAMPPGLPAGRGKVPFREILSKSANVNWLSAARLFLFGARDIWFVVGVPIYFYEVLSDGGTEGRREAFMLVGGFMALWIIGYGAVQAATPRLLNLAAEAAQDEPGQDQPGAIRKERRAVLRWGAALAALPALLAATVLATPSFPLLTTGILVAGLLLFGALFAVNSALHSFLILAFSRAERVTMDVGFYYMSNAAGRLVGTLLSGLSYQALGLAGCLAASAAFVALSLAAASRLR
ncbi:organoarsenical effux MFS transporter ArsJ [Marinibaculum pumilum]|uniref:Organoarsenical effux MFS transporter ArsJ n=1 Tax=Marinibaculum pumilum TaxID=1766165 RepID=A0ABV7L9M6_9PROT